MQETIDKIVGLRKPVIGGGILRAPTGIKKHNRPTCIVGNSPRRWTEGRHLFPSAKLTWRHLISGEHLGFTSRLPIVKTNMADDLLWVHVCPADYLCFSVHIKKGSDFFSINLWKLRVNWTRVKLFYTLKACHSGKRQFDGWRDR